MSTELVGLALLMAAVTYPARAVPLLPPAFDRLPARALEYLRLVGPAVLGAIAAKELEAAESLPLVRRAVRTRVRRVAG